MISLLAGGWMTDVWCRMSDVGGLVPCHFGGSSEEDILKNDEKPREPKLLNFTNHYSSFTNH